jgi:hypothetical protein
MKLSKPKRWFVIVLSVLLLYAVSYYMDVTPNQGYHVTSLDEATDAIPLIRAADYRFGGGTARSLYAPMEQLDRRVFPRRWIVTQEDMESDLTKAIIKKRESK